jgi:hypothetical protein
MKRTLGTIALIFVLALTACGGSSKKSGTTGPTTSTDTAAADRAKAEKLVLIQTDFPAGWTATPPTPDPNEDAQGKELAACAGAVDPDVAESAEVDGPDVEKDNASVSSNATFVKTAAYAQTDLAAITGSKIEKCVEDFAKKALNEELASDESGAQLVSVRFDRITVTKYGDATVGFRLIATISAGGQSIAAYQDLIFILKGRAEVSASFFDLGKPFDATLQRDLLAKLGAKLATV